MSIVNFMMMDLLKNISRIYNTELLVFIMAVLDPLVELENSANGLEQSLTVLQNLQWNTSATFKHMVTTFTFGYNFHTQNTLQSHVSRIRRSERVYEKLKRQKGASAILVQISYARFAEFLQAQYCPPGFVRPRNNPVMFVHKGHPVKARKVRGSNPPRYYIPWEVLLDRSGLLTYEPGHSFPDYNHCRVSFIVMESGANPKFDTAIRYITAFTEPNYSSTIDAC
eukprot:UN27150